MVEQLGWVMNEYSCRGDQNYESEALTKDNIEQVRDFFSKFNEYKPTPLYSLQQLAEYLGVGGIYVKDESRRMGLNAFKVLGSCYAVARCIAKRLGKDLQDISFEELKSGETKKKTGEIVFTTATDGNHGRGVAWTAKQLNQKAIVYVPRGTAQKRIENIEALGAKVIVTDKNYNDTVRMAIENAAVNGWEIVQDTAWEGYEEIPLHIMQGYGLIALEALDQLKEMRIDKPTHIFIQAGVGSLAGSILGFFSAAFGVERPSMVIVEPRKADCIYRSLKAGEMEVVDGAMDTIMAGLACGEPNPLAWEIIKKNCDMAVSLPEYFAAQGMRILANPLPQDPTIVSGESGAVTTGFLSEIMRSGRLEEIKNALGLDRNARVLLISTEGETDPGIYRKVVWDGYYSLKE